MVASMLIMQYAKVPIPDLTIQHTMNLIALRSIVAVSRAGSFSRAAAALGVDQSALSRHVLAFERDISGPVFHRTGRGVELTELGHALVPRAERLLEDADALIAIARKTSSSPSGSVDVGLVSAVSRPLAGLLYERLHRDYPGIRLRVHEAYSGKIEEWLAGGNVQVGVFNRFGSSKPADAEPLLRSEIMLLGVAGHPALRDPEIPLASVAGLPIVVPIAPNGLTTALLKHGKALGVDFNIAMEGGTSNIITDAILNGRMFTLGPLHEITRELNAGLLSAATIIKPRLSQSTWLSLSSHLPPASAARVVARCLRELVEGLVKRGLWAGARDLHKPGRTGMR